MKRQNKKALKILFDANPLVGDSKSGVGYYTKGLIEALSDNYPDELQLIGHYFNFLGRKKVIDLPERPNIAYKRTIFFPTRALSVLRRIGIWLPIELFSRSRTDINLFTNFVSSPSLFHKPTIITVHDLGYIEAPQYVSSPNAKFLKKYVRVSAKAAARIFAVSESTKSALIRHYSLDEEKVVVTVIPPQPPVTNKRDNPIGSKYILFLGTIEPRKNIVGLLDSYMGLPQELRDEYTLVLAGGKGWKDAEITQKLAMLKNENIITTGYISDEMKSALYQNASTFILPSHYEGFGMPVLEAMSYGLPVILSDIDVFHEVADNAGIYVNQDRPSEISKAIISVLTDMSLRNKMVTAGYHRVSVFDWGKVARLTYEEFLKVSQK